MKHSILFIVFLIISNYLNAQDINIPENESDKATFLEDRIAFSGNATVLYENMNITADSTVILYDSNRVEIFSNANPIVFDSVKEDTMYFLIVDSELCL